MGAGGGQRQAQGQGQGQGPLAARGGGDGGGSGDGQPGRSRDRGQAEAQQLPKGCRAVIVNGVQPPLDAPLAWLHAQLHAPDYFLYIVVRCD